MGHVANTDGVINRVLKLTVDNLSHSEVNACGAPEAATAWQAIGKFPYSSLHHT